jgi:secreted trypsin-like serine protease
MKPTAIFLTVASIASAGTTDDSIPDSVYVEYGHAFAAYVKKVEVVETSGKLAVGTGVLIGPRLAMTAAHVVEDARTVSVGGNPVVTVFIHPDFDTSRMGWNDIAILACKADFGLAYYPPYATEADNDAAICTLAGYGATGRISVGFTLSDGLLRAGTQRILRREGTLIVCDIQRGSSPREFGIAPGDSGGPLFTGSGPSARLAGIHSLTVRKGTGPLRSREGEESGHTDVSLFGVWIEQVKGMVE